MNNVTYFCIGTDRSTGDSLGPIVGSLLQERHPDWSVLGTLEDPVHAMNLDHSISQIPAGHTVIAIDACLGQLSSVGQVRFHKGPCRPGAALGKDLTHVGDFHYQAIVNVGGFMEHFVLQNTRLSRVLELAHQIVQRIEEGADLANGETNMDTTGRFELTQLFRPKTGADDAVRRANSEDLCAPTSPAVTESLRFTLP